MLVEDPRGAHAGAAGRQRLAAELKAKSFDRALLFPESFGTAWTAFQAGIPERIGWAADARSLLLSRALPPRLHRGRHQVWKHLLLARGRGRRPAGTARRVVERREGRARRRPRRPSRARAGTGRRSSPRTSPRSPTPPSGGTSRSSPRRSTGSPTSAGSSVVLLGSAGEAAVNAEAAARTRRARVVDLSGKSSLPEALGILSHAALFVGNDSGLAHLAGAAGTPTVVVFGPTDPGRDAAVGRPARRRLARADRDRTPQDRLRALPVRRLPDRPPLHGGARRRHRLRGGGVGALNSFPLRASRRRRGRARPGRSSGRPESRRAGGRRRSRRKAGRSRR